MADGLVATWSWAGRAGVVGPSSRHAARFQAVGSGTAFGFPPGPSMGERWIRIGSDNLICPDVVLSAGMWPDEPLRPERGWAVRIGDGCTIGRSTALVGRVGIDIGDGVTIGPGVYITDHNHDYTEVSVPISRQWVVSEPVTIGAGCWLGTGVVILPGTVIGDNVAVAAGSVVRGTIPDRSVVAGTPARVVRRWRDGAGWDPPLADHHRPEAESIPPGWYDGIVGLSGQPGPK